jgi:exosome complex component RRP41
MDGHLTYDEFKYALELGTKACEVVYEKQKDALRRRYAVDTEGEAAPEAENQNQEA